MKVAYLREIFSPDNLVNPDNLDQSLSYVRSHITQPSHHGGVRKVMVPLIGSDSYTGLFEFIAAQDPVVLRAVMAAFSQPEPDDCLSKPAFDHDFFKYLYTSFRHLLEYPNPNPELVRCQEKATHLREAFDALKTAHSALSEEGQKGPKTSKRQLKRGKTPKKKGNTEPRLLAIGLSAIFSKVGEGVPQNSWEIGAIYRRLASRRCRLLQEYLHGFQLPDIQSQAKKSFLGSVALDTLIPTSEISTVGTAQYFKDDADELGSWPIQISSRALRKVRRFAGVDTGVAPIVHRKIRDLSHGLFLEWVHTNLAGNINEAPLYKAETTGDLRMIYQTGCGPLPLKLLRSNDKESLRVLDICDYDELLTSPGFWEELAATTARRDKEYLQKTRSQEVPRMKTEWQHITHPATFGARLGGGTTSLSAEECNQIHDTIVISKYYPYSLKLLEAARLCDDVSGIFSTSYREDEIINYTSSSLVIGRSGTGKTTTIIFKMLDRELGALLKGEKIRQVFVTQSRVLASRVEENFHKMLQAVSQILGIDQNQKHFPVQPNQTEALDPGADDFGDGQRKRWNELDDQDFPLFLTFHKLCVLLENDCMPASSGRLATSRRQPGAQVALGGSKVMVPGRARLGLKRKKLLTYRMFRSNVWPHLDQRLSKYIDPLPLFNELMSVIMGAESSIATSKGHLDRESYEKLGPHPLGHDRSIVYSLFESYLKRRSSVDSDWFDITQRTHALLKHLQEDLVTTRADFLYVDEVQDHLIIDIQLLRLLCRNPQGHMWCGDTAQTISAGSLFRFQDLKSFLYRFEERDVAVVQHKRKAVHPQMFQLAVNYRSHSGIVETAASIVDLISNYFPHSIDRLDREEGLSPGPQPVFLTMLEQSLHYGVFCKFAAGASTSRLEFGANQVILVRDRDARAELETRMGKGLGLILTLYESKGLEFNDVLLYNFFASSPATTWDWRVLLNADQHTNSEQLGRIPLFSETRHGCLLGELKLLYVGITRARKNVWVIDPSDTGDALKSLWLSNGLIDETDVESIKSNTSTSGTSPGEWAAQGHTLFNRELYEQSAFCFEKAKCLPEKDRSLAYLLRDQALDIPTSNSRERKTAMLKAGAALRDCARTAVPSWRKMLRIRAAECFNEAQDYAQAGGLFKDAEQFEESVLAYRQGGLFDEAVSILKQPDAHIPSNVAGVIYDHAKVHYSKSKETQKAAALFDEPAQHLEFLEELGFDNERIELLESLDQHDEAAKICLDNGDYVGAVKHLLQSSSPGSRDRAVQWLFESLSQLFPLRDHNKPRPLTKTHVGELMDLTSQFPLGKVYTLKVGVFRALSQEDVFGSNSNSRGLLRKLGRQLLLEGSPATAILALDEALRHPLHDLTLESLENVSVLLQDHYDYARLLHRIASMDHPFKDPDIAKLLGVRPVNLLSSNTEAEYDFQDVVITPESFLYSAACDLGAPNRSENDGEQADSNNQVTAEKHAETEIIRDCQSMENVMQRVLRRRINGVLYILHLSATRIKSMWVCDEHSVFGTCRRENCRRQHVDASELDIPTYNQRFRAHLLLVRALDRQIAVESGDSQADGRDRSSAQRVWLERLFELINPPSSQLGLLLNVRPEIIPEYDECMAVVRSWVQERFLLLKPPAWLEFPHDAALYFNAILSTTMLAFQLDRGNAMSYARRGQWGRKIWEWTSPKMAFLGNYRLGRPLIEDALRWLFCFPHSWDHGLTGAINFIHLVVEERVSMDMNVLAHFIERVVAHVILSKQRRRLAHGVVPQDGVTASRSMLVDAMQIPPCKIPLHKILALVQAIGKLIQNLGDATNGNGPPFFWYLKSLGRRESPPQPRQSSFTLVVSRICDVIILLGINIRDAPVQDMVKGTLRLLLGTPFTRNQNLREYAIATRWVALERALKNTRPISPFDELVTLASGKHRTFRPPLPGAKVIFFDDSEDLLNKLWGSEAGPPHRQETQVTFKKEALEEIHQEQEIAPRDDEETEDWQAVGPTEASFAIDITPEQEWASQVIQEAYGRYRRRVTGVHKCGVYYEKCREEIRSGSIGKSVSPSYAMLYLGPLPHILLYLDKLMRAVNMDKKKLNDKLQGANHEEYAYLLDERNSVGLLLSDAKTLAQKLGALSGIHLRSSVDELKTLLGKVVALKEDALALVNTREEVRYLSKNNSIGKLHDTLRLLMADADAEADYTIGIKGILKERTAGNI